jgi:hypothetical protein
MLYILKYVFVVIFKIYSNTKLPFPDVNKILNGMLARFFSFIIYHAQRKFVSTADFMITIDGKNGNSNNNREETYLSVQKVPIRFTRHTKNSQESLVNKPKSIKKLSNVSFLLHGSSMDRHQLAGDRTMGKDFHRFPLDARKLKQTDL